MRADAEIILEELDRLATISERMLLLASAQNPHLQTLEPVNLERLVRTAVDRWTATAERTWKVTTHGTASVLGDEEQLRAALDALIENALKATANGDMIGVALHAEDDTVILEVSDTGIGIATGDLERIFERYSRVRTARQEGMGLGLPIVKTIVEAHDGSVTVTSDPGKSTTFRLCFARLGSTPVAGQDDLLVPPPPRRRPEEELLPLQEEVLAG